MNTQTVSARLVDQLKAALEDNERLVMRCDELQRELGLFTDLPGWLPLTTAKRRMLGVLLKRDTVSRAGLLLCISDRASDNTVDVHLSGLRRWMRKEFGVNIVCHTGVGWSLHPADKVKIAKKLGLPDQPGGSNGNANSIGGA